MAKQSQPVEKRVSTRREDMVKGGSLFDDIDVVIRNPRYEPFQYPGGKVEVPALGLTLEREDGEVFEQHWSAGGKSKLMPSRNGEFLVAEDPEDPPDGLNEGSNLGVFYASLDQLAPQLIDVREEQGVTAALDGLKVHMKNKVPEGQIEGKARNPVMCVSKVYGNGAKSSAATKATTKAKTVEAEDTETEAAGADDEPEQSEMELAVTAAVKKMLKKAGAPMSRAELMKGLGEFFEGAEKREATEVLVTPGFLKGGPWEWDGKVASL